MFQSSSLTLVGSDPGAEETRPSAEGSPGDGGSKLHRNARSSRLCNGKKLKLCAENLARNKAEGSWQDKASFPYANGTSPSAE